MILSILILTNNREYLFRRCLKQFLDIIQEYNLDSNYIKLIINEDISYNRNNKKYNKYVENVIIDLQKDYSFDIHRYTIIKYIHSYNLGIIYDSLLKQAIKIDSKHVYYFEDDDIPYIQLGKLFKSLEKSNYDIYFMNYKIKYDDYKLMLEILKANKIFEKNIKDINFQSWNDYHFQFSQILFKTKLLYSVPKNNDLNNDYKVFKKIFKRANSLKYIKNILWEKTIDSNNNISHSDLNKDSRWSRNSTT